MRPTKILFAILLFVFSFNCFSQNWLTSFEEAKSIASKENRKIVLVFSGSDWCGPCIKLDNEIWKTDEFQSYAKNNFVMIRADFPRRKKNALNSEQQEHNNKLAEAYNKNGFFPLVVVFDSTGKHIGETGYKKKSPKEYIKIIESL